MVERVVARYCARSHPTPRGPSSASFRANWATATPTIITTFGHPGAYPWVSGTHLLASALVLPVAGVVTDRGGARPVYLTGMSLFALAAAVVADTGGKLSHAASVDGSRGTITLKG